MDCSPDVPSDTEFIEELPTPAMTLAPEAEHERSGVTGSSHVTDVAQTAFPRKLQPPPPASSSSQPVSFRFAD